MTKKQPNDLALALRYARQVAKLQAQVMDLSNKSAVVWERLSPADREAVKSARVALRAKHRWADK